VAAAGCVADTGLCQGLSPTGFYLGFLHSNFNSNTWTGHYPNASGNLNITNNCKTGAYNASTSSYISFLVTPASGYGVTITSISFGVLNTFSQLGTTGPVSYNIATSADGFASVIATGTIGTNTYGGAKKVHSGLNITGTPGVPVEVRVYGVNATSVYTGGNLVIDDMVIDYTVNTPSAAITTGTVSATSFCVGSMVSVPYTVVGTFNAGNVFTAQLSDASGSFTTPVAIGSVTATASGTITATIPANTPAGTGYRIRVVGNTPATTGTDNGTNITMNALPTIAVGGDTTTCSGAGVTLTASGGNTYTWSPAAGLSASTGNTITASPTTTTTYTITGIDANGCSNTATKTVAVNTAITAFTITPSAASICAGDSVLLTSNVTGTTTILSQGFNTANPSGWTVTYTGSVNSEWQLRAYGFVTDGTTVHSADGTSFFEADGTAGGNGAKSTILTSPAFSLAGVSAASFTYYNWYDHSSSDTYVGVEISTNGGASWATLSTPPQGSYGGTQTLSLITVSLNSYIGNANVQVRFRYASNYGYAWAIDNVNITGTPLPAWSPVTGLFTDAGLTTAYTSGQQIAKVFAAPTGTTVYTATVGNCSATATATVTVNQPVVPSVTLSTNATDTICAGTAITFTGTPVNGGNTPSYQWTKNGSNVGANNASYTDNALNTGDIIVCKLTSNAACALPATATDTTTMFVNPILIPAVSIAANPGDTICSGTVVTFTASPINGGNTPSYQWTKNGNPVGTTNSVYTDNALNNGDIITTILTSDATCAIPATANADTITMTVNPTLTPAAVITANPGTSICQGTAVTFTVTPTNGGNAPSYQWTKNGNPVGSTDAFYTDNALNNGDVISTILTSNATCATPAVVNADTLTMTVTATVTPGVSIAAAPSLIICAGTSVTFTATPVNGGNTPSYQWTKNGNPVGTTNATYTDNGLNNGDTIVAILTSNAACAMPANAISNTDTITVNPLVTPLVHIQALPGDTICAGSPVTIAATPTNGGNNPTYVWMKNGNSAGVGSPYIDNTIANNDIIICKLTSDATCITADTAFDTIHFIVHPLPVPVITASGINLSTSTFATYQWFRNNVVIPGATNQHYTATLSGSYRVLVTDANGCSDTSVVYLNHGLGVNSLAGVHDTNLYPNPNKGIFSIEAACNGSTAFVSILNTLGQVVYRKNVTIVNGMVSERIELNNPPDGMYLLRIDTEDGPQTVQFIIR
jgi:hypothetical protein